MHENKLSVVHHARDPRFLTLRSLQTPAGRFRTGSYLIEGIRHLARAVEHNAPIQSVFYDPSVLSNRFGRKLARRLRQSGLPSTQLSPQLYRELTLATEPQGIGAVLRQHWTSLAELRVSPDSLWLAVESLDSPGNLGTIIRTAEAAGIAAIFMISPGADPWNPAAVRASMGSLFSQKLVRCSHREFVDWAQSSSVTLVGSSPNGLMDYRTWRCRWPAALLIGSEKEGLSEGLIEASNLTVRIPMVGRGESINAAVAAGILLFEMSNQRRGV